VKCDEGVLRHGRAPPRPGARQRWGRQSRGAWSGARGHRGVGCDPRSTSPPKTPEELDVGFSKSAVSGPGVPKSGKEELDGRSIGERHREACRARNADFKHAERGCVGDMSVRRAGSPRRPSQPPEAFWVYVSMSPGFQPQPGAPGDPRASILRLSRNHSRVFLTAGENRRDPRECAGAYRRGASTYRPEEPASALAVVQSDQDPDREIQPRGVIRDRDADAQGIDRWAVAGAARSPGCATRSSSPPRSRARRESLGRPSFAVKRLYARPAPRDSLTASKTGRTVEFGTGR